MQTDKEMGPERVRVTQFRANLPSFLREVRAGKSFLLTSHDEVVAELHPPHRSSRKPREPGTMRGRIFIAPDFDEWPPEIQATFDASLEEDLEE